jgi:hypothetical protein
MDKEYKTVRFIESWKTGKFSGFPKDDSPEELSKYTKNNLQFLITVEQETDAIIFAR